jgi:cytochrome c-type biogenesis protein CcmH/NrfG
MKEVRAMRRFNAALVILILICIPLSSASAQKRYKISGQVVDKGNKPLAGVLVRVRRRLETLATQRTDKGGRYSLEFKAGGPIDIVEYECYDCYPCSIINVSGAIDHNVTKVIVKKGTQLSASDRSEIRATLEYYNSNPELHAAQVAQYADLIKEMLPASPPKQRESLVQEFRIMPSATPNPSLVPEKPSLEKAMVADVKTSQATTKLEWALQGSDHEKVMFRNFKMNAADQLASAHTLYAEGRDTEAFIEVHRALQENQTIPEAYLLLGRIYERRGDPRTAVSALKTALFWDEKLVDAHLLLGSIYFRQGNSALALSHVRIASQIDPGNKEVLALQKQINRFINTAIPAGVRE